MDDDHSNDITAVVKMVKDFKSFINKPTRSTASGWNDSFGNETLGSSDHFSSLNKSSFSNYSSVPRKRNSDADYFTLSKDERADIIAAKTKVAKLETDLNTSKMEKKKFQIEEEARNKVSFSRLIKERGETDGMRRRFKQLVNERDTVITELEKIKEREKASETLFNFDVARLKDENDQLLTKYNEARESNSNELLDLRENCARQSADILVYKSKLEESQLQLKTFKSRHKKTSVLCQDYNEVKYRHEVAEAKCKTLQEKLLKVDDASLIMQHSQSELANYRSMEKENKRLKDENQLLRDGEENMLILNEKIKNQALKLDEAESTIENLRKHKFENEILKFKVAEYGDRPKSVGELTRIITELQNSTIASSEKNGELEMSLTLLDATFTRKLEEMTQLTESTTLLQNKHDQLDDKLKKLQRRLTLITAERDGLRRVLSSYEVEDGKAPRVELEEARTLNGQAQRQIKKLEAQLVEMRTDLNQSNINSGNTTFHSSHDITVSMKDSAQLKESKKRLVQMQIDQEKLKQENEDMKIIIGQRELQGLYNPLETKLIHLKDNPAQMAYKNYAREMENIRIENDQLRKNVLKLQNQLDDNNQEDNSCMDMSTLIKGSKHMEELRKQLEREKLTKKRLSKKYEKEVKAFRSAVQQILGYIFKPTKDGVYKAQSIFSTHDDDFFLFTCSKNDEGEVVPGMIETAFTHQWTQLFKDYIQRGDSIPAFLASVTLELFSQITEVRDTTVAQKAKQI